MGTMLGVRDTKSRKRNGIWPHRTYNAEWEGDKKHHADENCQHKYSTGKAHRVVEIEARECNPTPFEQRVV